MSSDPALSHPIDPHLIETAASWASRRGEGMLSPLEESEFEAWLDASPLHARALEQVDLGWLALADAANAPDLVAMRGGALERARRLNGRRWARHALSDRGRLVALAAMLLIAVFAGVVGLKVMPQTYETGIGERRVVALGDGSHISLDGATEVRVRFFNNRRELWLDHGRAKFDVAHDPLQPFTVTAANRTVVATGTSFSVELVNQQIRVVLYEGSVSVLAEADQGRPRPLIVDRQLASQALTPGRELIAPIGATPIASTAPVDPVRSRAWEGGQLMFDDEALPVAVARLNRYSSEQLVVGDDVAANMRVSGVYNAGDVAAFLDGTTRVLPLRAVQRGNQVVLSADPATFSHDRGVNRVP
jgi:transmembrane sensor